MQRVIKTKEIVYGTHKPIMKALIVFKTVLNILNLKAIIPIKTGTL